ncbi:MAG: thioredoxin fold domain-containing protein [Gammaproteobacteria bacterium]|nr:thioredoxin fold domain-containing protein [Gammaproteobacteria bacterium]
MRELMMLMCLLSPPSMAALDTVYPDWFYPSFLELDDDALIAGDEDKSLMLFVMQSECPYCHEMVQTTFADPSVREHIEAQFLVVQIDMFGSREVMVGGQSMTETEFAKRLGIQFTPTLLVFDAALNLTQRIDGFLAPEAFLDRLSKPVVAVQRENSVLYINWPRECNEACQRLKAIRSSVDELTIVERNSNLEPWPSLYFADDVQGELVNTNAMFKPLHFRAILSWLSTKAYRDEPEFQRYLNRYADVLRDSGEIVEVWAD